MFYSCLTVCCWSNFVWSSLLLVNMNSCKQVFGGLIDLDTTTGSSAQRQKLAQARSTLGCKFQNSTFANLHHLCHLYSSCNKKFKCDLYGHIAKSVHVQMAFVWQRNNSFGQKPESPTNGLDKYLTAYLIAGFEMCQHNKYGVQLIHNIHTSLSSISEQKDTL